MSIAKARHWLLALFFDGEKRVSFRPSLTRDDATWHLLLDTWGGFAIGGEQGFSGSALTGFAF